VGQTIGAAAGAQLASLGTEMVRQGLTVKPTIVVPAGAPVTVLLADDIEFPGVYRDARWAAQ
jgi:type IV secretory pathway VirB10-like protein